MNSQVAIATRFDDIHTTQQNGPDRSHNSSPTIQVLSRTSTDESENANTRHRVWSCEICKAKRVQRAFTSQNDLSRHLRTVHSKLEEGDRIWRCRVQDCNSYGKVWARLDNFKLHVSRVHGQSNLRDLRMRGELYDPIALDAATNSVANDIHEKPWADGDQFSRLSSPSISTRITVSDSSHGPTRAQTYDILAEKNDASLISEDDNDVDNDIRPPVTSDRKSGDDVAELFFACPFYVHDRQQYAACGSKVLRNITTLKQHLNRQHRMSKLYCAICYRTFEAIEARDEHWRQQSCAKTDNPFKNEMSEATWVRVNQKKTRIWNNSEEWYRIFETIFPDELRPQSPYVMNKTSAWYCVMLETFRLYEPNANYLHDTLVKLLDSSSLTPQCVKAVIFAAFAAYQEESEHRIEWSDCQPPEKVGRSNRPINTTNGKQCLSVATSSGSRSQFDTIRVVEQQVSDIARFGDLFSGNRTAGRRVLGPLGCTSESTYRENTSKRPFNTV